MFPVRDNIPTQTVPWVNYCILWVNLGVWFYQLSLDEPSLLAFFHQFGLVPAAFDPAATSGAMPDALLSLGTSMFMHGGWMHIIGNMWMLWIFGDNVEEHLGHGRYMLFYLLVGLGAGAAHLFTNWGSVIPTVGASGAIAGVMGAYLVLYPGALVLTYVPILFILVPMALPAVLFIGIWFVIQFLSGTASLMNAADDGGVAWWAHIGGFIVGVVLVAVLGARRPRRKPAPGRMGRVARHPDAQWRRGAWPP